MKVLIIQQKMIGDVLTSSILFETIKKKFPDSELHYLINANTHPVVEHHPFVDQFITLAPKQSNNTFQLLKFAYSLRKHKYDVLIDVYAKLSSNLISIVSNAKIKISYQKKFRNFIYTDTIIREKPSTDKSGLEIANRLALLKPLGLEINSAKPKIYITPEESEKAKNLLTDANISFLKPIFMVSVIGSSINKSYPFPYMAKIIDRLFEMTQGQILFNYMPNQKEQAKSVYEHCSIGTKKNIHLSLIGNNLRDFIGVTSLCSALIGNEGGAVNMAKALNVPTYAIFSPWIDKSGWNMFEDNKKHMSVHLKDFKPELFKNKKAKQLKEESDFLYAKFEPNIILPSLEYFLQEL